MIYALIVGYFFIIALLLIILRRNIKTETCAVTWYLGRQDAYSFKKLVNGIWIGLSECDSLTDAEKLQRLTDLSYELLRTVFGITDEISIKTEYIHGNYSSKLLRQDIDYVQCIFKDNTGEVQDSIWLWRKNKNDWSAIPPRKKLI